MVDIPWAAGLTWQEAKARCPSGIAPACHNSTDTVTISGPAESISQFVAELKEEGIFAKEVKSSGVAFHSHYMQRTAPALKEALLKVGCNLNIVFIYVLLLFRKILNVLNYLARFNMLLLFIKT